MKKYLYLFLIIFLTFWAVRSLFHSGFFPMHDDQQIARLYELDQTLKGGQFPPRWVSDLGFGYGYPLFNFYPPLVYYLGEVFHLGGIDLISSTKIVMILGFFLSALFMYFFVKDFLGHKAGILAAVFYTYAPYHSVDLYVRGALAEFFSFVFFPLILLALKKIIETPNLKNVIILSFSLTGLILTHNLMVIPFAIFLTFYTVFLIVYYHNFKFLLPLLYSLSLAFGLSAYFTLPALFEQKFTLVDQILTKELASYKLHFVYLRQFWSSPWGYGGSIYGLLDGLSFQIGKIHILLSIVGFLAALFFIVKKTRLKENIFILLLGFLLLLSVYLSTFHSQWLWNLVKPLWYLQFPWRFLVFTAVFSSVLAAFGAKSVWQIVKNKIIQNIIFLFFIILVIFVNYNFFQPARYLNISDKSYTSVADISWRISKTSFEFVPKEVKTTLSDIGTTQLDIKRDEIGETGFQIINGNLNVRENKNLSAQKEFLINSTSGGIIRINTFNFPGWQATIDGNKTLIDDHNKLKLITITLPKGDHVLKVEFVNTPIRTVSNYLSLLSFMLLIGLSVIILSKKTIKI